MQLADTARAKARAAVSGAQAEITTLEAQLAQARRTLDRSETAKEVLESVRETPLVGTLTTGVREQAGVDQADATADIDRITAELANARTKLELAQKAESLVLEATGGQADVQEAPEQPDQTGLTDAPDQTGLTDAPDQTGLTDS